MLLRFELRSSVLRVLRLVHCTTAADRENTQYFIATNRLAVNLSSDNQLYFRISGGIYRVRSEITRR